MPAHTTEYEGLAAVAAVIVLEILHETPPTLEAEKSSEGRDINSTKILFA